MNVLLIGSGGREHAIAEAISGSFNEPELYAAMSKKNPGISKLCKGLKIISEDDCGIVDYAEKEKIELAVIGGETPLAAGIPDLLWDAGIPTMGPKKLAAQIETKKPWMRENILKSHHIPGNPPYCIFRKDENTVFDVGAYIDELVSQGIDPVIKPAGLTGGKGVRLFPDHFDIGGAKEYAAEVLKNEDLVIEERLYGEEFTLQAFVDGDRLAFGPAVQDEKRAWEKGPNTGGMGSYNDSKDILPFMTQSDYDDAKQIMGDAVRAIKKETGLPYQGVLYGQFMATANGISVIEFNARGGDSEFINILSLLKSDALDVFNAIVNGTLHKENVKFRKQATVFKYGVPDGYPKNPVVDSAIIIQKPGSSQLIYANVYENGGNVYTTKSRAFGFLGAGANLGEAEKNAEAGFSGVQGAIYHRKDIATQEHIRNAILNMQNLRGCDYLGC